ncbi:MAG TPA: nucleotidyltransferase domain-containing protein [Ignavibacteria bacterium]|nr:nucleotidyltransferase [Bacteroidota bacterium]HRE12019.1 nucleotidyltransferase domain-containing protein [Ignavibacteria bacterium]HRF65450.1 nucleotidyltransferase domain-containing protein [Ignavibacteria bacterium]HRJ04549.1 nucleotidyltransferase domain-containing protein [Ignavibacteria bacterium]HRJ85344.1 nucleotidyltransferase domain-containing protein [Ignavibacteria bacterium]
MNELNKEKIISILKEQITFLNERYHLRKIGLFGSYAVESQTESSDIDLIVDFDKPIGLDFVELGDYLENLLNKKVDLITFEGLKNSNLNLKTNQIIYVN